MVIFKEKINYNDYVPTYRFYLMLKLKKNNDFWDRRFDSAVEEIKKDVKENIESCNNDENSQKEIENMIEKVTERIANSSWRTMPSEFLQSLGVPRNLHL